MSSTTIDPTTFYLNNATVQMNRYVPIVIYIFGSIGNILNIFVLLQRIFRSNSCAFLFLVSSIGSLVAILAGFTSRVLPSWIPDLTNTVDWICQMRAFILFLSRMIVMWLITLATVDRWLVSSPKVERRNLRNWKNAVRCSVVLFIIAILFNIPILICYQANLSDTPQKCYGKTDLCRITADLTYGCVTILIPTLFMFMFIFFFLIMRNVRQCQKRIENNCNISHTNSPVEKTAKSKKRSKKRERQLLFMSLIQVCCLIISTFPQAIQKLYATITLKMTPTVKSPLQNALENFIFNLVILLTYIANGLPFYLYTLTGGRTLRDGCRTCLRTFNSP